jgi:predicted ATPase
LIKYFTVENYGAIKNENILEFDINVEKFPAHPVIGFAGANASGKTTILQALNFVLWFMQRSFLQLEEGAFIPCEPFYTLAHTPTQFHLIFTKNAVDYEYKLCLTKEKVLTETLNYFPEGKGMLVYQRQNSHIQFGNNVSQFDYKDLRDNCSFISFAAQFASQTIAKACKDYMVQSNLTSSDRIKVGLKMAFLDKWLENETVRQKVQAFLKIADVGIEEIYLQFEQLRIHAGGKLQKTSNSKTFFKHKIDNLLADFDYSMESAGTLQFLIVLQPILQALQNGAILIFDEIELKLHQNLVAYLLALFENHAENQQGAQLIFSFHNTYLMEFLKPEQLWFAEKNAEGQTELFSAAAFTDIKNLYEKDLEILYRVGRFGAKPREIE